MRLLEEAAANGTAVIVASHQPTFSANRVLRLPSGKVMVHRGRTHVTNGNHARQPFWRRVLPVQSRPAASVIACMIVVRSVGDEAMTRRISLVAVCCSSAS